MLAVTYMQDVQILQKKTMFWRKTFQGRRGASLVCVTALLGAGLPPAPFGDISSPQQPSEAPFPQ